MFVDYLRITAKKIPEFGIWNYWDYWTANNDEIIANKAPFYFYFFEPK